MRPIEFPEQTTVWAKNQPEYLPLPSYTNDHETVTCWRLTWRERLRIFWTGSCGSGSATSVTHSSHNCRRLSLRLCLPVPHRRTRDGLR